MTQLLEGKNAIIYGAGGRLGRGVARTFAGEGATVFLVGRTEATLETLADDIASGGGRAHVALVDALDEQAVAEHARSVVDQAGGIDVSFNLTSRGDVQGTPLLDMDVDDFLRPITTGSRSNFITARAAARHMVQQESGVILMLTSGSGKVVTPHWQDWSMGGTGPADAATETFMRYLGAEVGPRGVRVVGLWTAGVVDTIRSDADPNVNRQEAVKQSLAALSMLRRAPRLQQVADTATFLASDRASGITASIVNVNSGISAR